MLNQKTLENEWKQVCRKIKSRWDQVADPDLKQFNGNLRELVALIQDKTGEASATIESSLQELMAESRSFLGETVQQTRELAERAADSVSHLASQAAASTQDLAETAYRESERFVRHRPMESLAVLFSAGLVAGVIVGLTLRSK